MVVVVGVHGADVAFVGLVREAHARPGVKAVRSGLGDGLGVREEDSVFFVFAEGVVAGWVCSSRCIGVRVVDGAAVAAVDGAVVGARELETRSLLGGLVADVLFSAPATDRKPAEPATDGFDEIPGVEDIGHGVDAHWPAAVSGFGIGEVARSGFRSNDLGAPDVVDFPREGP